MDGSCIILTCLLLLQMIALLVMLNPIYDTREIVDLINTITLEYKRYYYCSVYIYFTAVIYFGMYNPLRDIHRLIFSSHLNEYEKLILLSRVEKNYVIAGFSLFLVIVLYGMRALLSYTANLATITDKRSESLIVKQQNSDKKLTPEYILANLLRVKRSISYETILFANELKEQLKMMINSTDFAHNRSTLNNILETSNAL
ncbi:hypothetical protein K1T71_009135 [Dendrolimus kikuchii]|uniref:Uncharacterized protein n=1 Tax=Dendrolimus kikuchii TaxID=765133 RepID=A0ACC1CTL8_9NEOP|nr:hypothetical protein K1T71_009135 [Dendrolimus kikuchii]